MPRKAPISHPELILDLPVRPDADPRQLLLKGVPGEIARRALQALFAVISTESYLAGEFAPSDVAPSERWRWPGKDLLKQRHKIIIDTHTPEDISQMQREIETLSATTGYSKLATAILYKRGFTNPRAISEVTNPDLESDLKKLPSYPEISTAAELIRKSVERGERIVIVADYDADGNCSAAQLKIALNSIGASPTVIQPDRVINEYGLKDSILKSVQDLNPDLVITLDLGTANKGQIAKLIESGTKVIIVDHHPVKAEHAATPTILVNPHQRCDEEGPSEPLKILCASGLSWLLCREIFKGVGDSDLTARADQLLPLAAIGTVADVMELKGFNRSLVSKGLELLKSSEIPLLRIIGEYVAANDITAEYVGYTIGPVLNACGRINPGADGVPGTAPVLEGLTTPSPSRARECYNLMLRTNLRRREIEAQALESARKEVEAEKRAGRLVHCGVVVALPELHEGVVGLVAARITEMMQCPSVVLTLDKNGDWKGSARSVPGISLPQILGVREFEQVIAEYGGHDAAAGLKIRRDNLEGFKVIFDRICSEVFGVSRPEDSPFYDKNRERAPLPLVPRTFKDYRPDLILTIDQLGERWREVLEAAKLLEPCGRGNSPVKILLPRVRICSAQTTKAGHLRVFLEDGDQPGRDWPTKSQIEAVVFKRGLPFSVLNESAPHDLYDLVVQPSFDRAKIGQSVGGSLNVNILIAEPTRFNVRSADDKIDGRLPGVKKRSATSAHVQERGLDRSSDLPNFTDLSQFKRFFGITCLSEQVQFRADQIRFVAREMDRQLRIDRGERIGEKNLLYKVNTGGGKTVIALFEIARILSSEPEAKILYLTTQHDLVQQAIESAKRFLNLPEGTIREITGDIPSEKRKETYNSSVARLFVGTPHTIKNDGDLSNFRFVVLDEIQIMRGDSPDRDQTRYAYRWIVEEVIARQEKGEKVNLWAQSGTPATNRDEARLLIRTLKSRWAKAWLSSGKNDWRSHDVKLSGAIVEALFELKECYRECYRELLAMQPEWCDGAVKEGALDKVYADYGRAIRSLFAIHDTKNNRIFPSRSGLIHTRQEVLKRCNAIEKRVKDSGGEIAGGKRWIWQVRSRLSELDLIARLFDETRSKGRMALAPMIATEILSCFFPAKGDNPESLANFKVRLLRRNAMKGVLNWVMNEPLLVSLMGEFRSIYPGSHTAQMREGWSQIPRGAVRSWQEILGVPATPDPSEGALPRNGESKWEEPLRLRLLNELTLSHLIDPKEIEIVHILRELSSRAKVMIMCEKKFEAELLANRLTREGFSAAWYAGKSVKKSVGLDKNLERFKNGEVQILCCTSVGDTGHDIPEVTNIIRITPLSSPVRNAQSRGRAARQEGLEGLYTTLVARHSDPELDEIGRYYRARTRMWAMERIGVAKS